MPMLIIVWDGEDVDYAIQKAGWEELGASV